ncbi:A/G-specific adenine glycosylase [Aquabacterium humicola]|uniref:A/G-specific adenine glycosylase n=1 Tax=Aquabacterium humicola TaxID=3237377 RepID=UPI0025428E5C|nr:A/G-specific adenine glycosylase [Rubrivivax pictus]
MTAAKPSAAALIAWQRTHGRHELPWQRTRDPYRVWLSEIMLQQTQVSTVVGYYERFLQRFPDVQALAAAPQDEVLALWSGLGYYSRARHLHACAKAVVECHGGAFPRSSAALAKLPGIGRSTASAIAAFCFGERTAILDGNVKRVLTRALGFDADLTVAANEKRLWQHAEALLPKDGIEAYTQGLMDLGATICTLRRPACDACPWRAPCVARAQGRPEAYPVKTRKLKRGQRDNSLLLLSAGRQLWLVQRPTPGVWAGLWSLPEYDAEAVALLLLADRGPGEIERLPAVRHVLTHFDWQLRPWHWRLPEKVAASTRSRIERSLPPGRWFHVDEALAAGLPAPVRKLIEALA